MAKLGVIEAVPNDVGCASRIIRIDGNHSAIKRARDLRSFYRNPVQCEPVVRAIREVVREKNIRLISYDVFDTILLRESRSEAGRFWDIARKFTATIQARGGGHGFSAEDAFLARAMAARASYSMSPMMAGNREGRFDDIARITCDLLGHPELTEAYIANELEYEAGAVAANPLVAMLAAALPQMPVICISDMYLERSQISRLLTEKLAPEMGGLVFSSADGFGSKRCGSIFGYVEESLRISGDAILHIGDNLHSDFRMPKQKGWNAFYLPIPDAEIQARRDCHSAISDHFARQGIALDNYLKFNL